MRLALFWGCAAIVAGTPRTGMAPPRERPIEPSSQSAAVRPGSDVRARVDATGVEEPDKAKQTALTGSTSTPRGKAIEVLGFWYQRCNVEEKAECVMPDGGLCWRVQCTPVVQGKQEVKPKLTVARRTPGEATKP